MENLNIRDLTDTKIMELFSEYVDSLDSKERHTNAACQKVDSFTEYIDSIFPDSTEMHIQLYDNMMDVAVEFEKSGFIAGFRAALQVAQEGRIDVATHIPPQELK